MRNLLLRKQKFVNPAGEPDMMTEKTLLEKHCFLRANCSMQLCKGL